MQKKTKSLLLLIILLLSIVTGTILYFGMVKKGNVLISIVDKFNVGKKGTGLGEFDAPRSLALNEKFLFTSELENNRIQVFEIKTDGSLIPKFAFGNQGKKLGEIGALLTALIFKNQFLYLIDADNNRIQVFELASH